MNSSATLQIPCNPHGQPTHLVIWTEGSAPSSSTSAFHEPILNALRQLTERIQVLEATVAEMKAASAAAQPQPQPQPSEAGLYFPPATSPRPAGLEVHAVEVKAPPPVEEPEPEPEPEQEEEQEDEEEQDEEESFTPPDMEPLTEFEWKGKSYWKDSENQVYEKDEDGDLNDTAIGVWNEEKQKLQRYAKV